MEPVSKDRFCPPPQLQHNKNLVKTDTGLQREFLNSDQVPY